MSDERIEELTATVERLSKAEEERNALLADRARADYRRQLKEVRAKIEKLSLDRLALIELRQKIVERTNEVDLVLKQERAKEAALSGMAGETGEAPDGGAL